MSCFNHWIREKTMDLFDTEIDVVDCETTGLDPAKDKVIEVAVVEYWECESYHPFDESNLFNPGMPIPPEASAVHHITDCDVDKCVPFTADAFDEMATNGVMAAHNARFDVQFLPVGNRQVICTMRLAQKLWPELESYGNQYLRYYLKFGVPWFMRSAAIHRAGPDAIVTACLLRHELNEVRTRFPEIKTVGELIAWINKPVLLHRVRFGKHKGLLWSEVPHDYLQWMRRNMTDMDEDTRYTIETLLGRN